MSDKPCPFCDLEPDRIISKSDHTVTIRDGFPVSEGHTLIIPKRHVKSFFELHAIEKAVVLQALDEAKEALEQRIHPGRLQHRQTVGSVPAVAQRAMADKLSFQPFN